LGESLVAMGVNEDSVISLVAQAPVGLLIAPHERVAIALHTGYRLLYIGHKNGSSETYSAVPFGGDLMFSLPAHVDLGVSGDAAGPISEHDDYLGYRQFMAWAQARF